MSFESRMTRRPIAFEPEHGADYRNLLPGASAAIEDLLEGAAGSSPHIRAMLAKEKDWLAETISDEPETALQDVLAAFEWDTPNLGDQLRIAKRRISLLAALADLAGVWPLETVTQALTDLADKAVDAALKSLVAAEITRGKIPGMGSGDVETAAGMCVLAMGKMGAGELNYSSDIDLIVLFDESRFDVDDYADARAAFIRITRRMTAMLSDLTGEGYVFRTDLRLRPDPSVTPVCLSMEAGERYYESVGRTWERAAHIKARPCAGDIAAGEKYLERLLPFVWRKHLDFAAIQDAHDMRLRIREHKGLHGPIVLEGHNMKLGQGGIREIEFFTQTRQIIAGGRDPELRSRQTVEGLHQLVAKDWVPKEAADTLIEDYRAHREIEHRLQMINDAQTHDLPKTEEGFDRLAALCGRDVAELRRDILMRLARVAEVIESFFAPDAPEASDTEFLSIEMSARWLTFPALRSERAAEIFSRIKPEILTRVQKAARPEEALQQFESFLKGLPAGVQVFSLFQANPQLIDLMVDIASTAPVLAEYLGRNSQVFDAVIAGDFFAPWPGADTLKQQLRDSLAKIDDYEDQLNAARRWQKEWHFQIGVHHLRGLIDAQTAGQHYAELADAVLGALWPVVADQFIKKHGPMPGNGAVILGLGSIGSQRMTAASDLDLIVIYDPADQDASEGRRPLPSKTYYARLTQAMVTALGAPMAEGRLYEVDMRLRPSGRQGPVATSISSFKTYQKDEAWTWEHLALTRARPIVGDIPLMDAIEVFRQEILNLPRDAKVILNDVSEMRQRIAEAKAVKTEWEAKLGRGRMQDIELLAQTAALLDGHTGRHISDQLKVAVELGWINNTQQELLAKTYALMWRLQASARLLTGEVLDLETIGQGGRQFLMRETHSDDVDALRSELAQISSAAADVIDQSFAKLPTKL